MTDLAPDPAVPRRDALLRPITVAGVLSTHLLRGVPVEHCELTHVKYRVGESLRAVYRYAGPDGVRRHVALRTVNRPPDAIYAPEVGAGLWPFPHDRKLDLRRLEAGPLSELLGRSCADVELVAYAAEASATVACRDTQGTLIAYAKLTPGSGEAGRTAHAAPFVRVPRVLAADGDVIALEPLRGRRLDHLSGLETERGLRTLGAALAALHGAPCPAERFDRLDPGRLATAAAMIARVRPDVAPLAERLLALLLRREPERAPACLHGDVNLRNALLSGDGSVALLDLEHLAAGEPAADLGQVLAGLLLARNGRAGGAALLAGYGEPPDAAALRWHTAASVLARVALPAVGHVRPGVLARLRELLEAASALVAPAAAARPAAAAAPRPAAASPPAAASRSAAAPPAAAAAPRPAAPSPRRRRPTLLFYCQHSVGLGHLMRSYALCARLADVFRVVLLCGGELPAGIAAPAGVEMVALPPLGVGANGFGSRSALSTEDAWAQRSERIQTVARELKPQVVLVELFPFGRAKFARELVPLLEATQGAFRACSLRDILVSARADQRAHDDRARTLADAHLDAVLVHCDPRFARLEDTFAPTEPLRVPVHYTGFVVGEGAPANGSRRPYVLVSAGGGRVGAPLLEAAFQAAPALAERGLSVRAIAGPLMPEEDLEALDIPPNVELIRCVPDLARELQHAAASVSQCGYNTALEVVRAGIPALVVPYGTPEEDEQRRRAQALARLGLVRTGEPTPEAIAALPDFAPARARLDLDGAARTRDLLLEAIR